jgi:GT2 family glycosyltransferase
MTVSNEKPIADIAVVISTYNRPSALELVFRGLARQRVKPRQIIVGDDGSGKDTSLVIKRWQDLGLPIEHRWHPDHGYRKTIIMNECVKQVRAATCLFMDGDCIPFEGFVEDHQRMSEQGVILAGPRMLANPTYTEKLESGQENCFNRSPLYWVRQRLMGQVNRLAPLIPLPDGGWRKANPEKWQLVRGCNFSVATENVLKVDGFEESLYGWGPDDSDIAVRLINSGARVKSLRYAAPVLHLWHKEEDRGNLSKNRQYLATAIKEKRVKAIMGISSHQSEAKL